MGPLAGQDLSRPRRGGHDVHRPVRKKSVISIDVPSWEDDLVQVTEVGTGATVRAGRRRGALEFVLEPGLDYAVRSIPMPPPVVLKADDDDGVARPD